MSNANENNDPDAMGPRQVGPNPEPADTSHDPAMYPTGGGVASTGDLGQAGDQDTLKEMNGDVPLPAGLDHHAPIPERSPDERRNDR